MKGKTETKASGPATTRPACVARLDRLQFVVPFEGRIFTRKVPKIRGFVGKSDHFVRSRGLVTTYRRVRSLEHPQSGTRLYVQYQRAHGWLKPYKVTLVGRDEIGLQLPELLTASEAFKDDTRVTMMELAFDFDPTSGIDRAFVLKHGLFGKSRPKPSSQFPGQLRYGTRGSKKMVRAYWKEQVNAFRVELELHSSWPGLPQSVYLLRHLPLGREAVRFVRFDWKAFKAHLRRCGLPLTKILHGARANSDSIHGLLAYLRHTVRLRNVHRFLRPLRMNVEIDRALDEWCASMDPRKHRVQPDKDRTQEGGGEDGGQNIESP